jgi:hypothetical protein
MQVGNAKLTSQFFIKVVVRPNLTCQLTREFVDVDKPEVFCFIESPYSLGYSEVCTRPSFTIIEEQKNKDLSSNDVYISLVEKERH